MIKCAHCGHEGQLYNEADFFVSTKGNSAATEYRQVVHEMPVFIMYTLICMKCMKVFGHKDGK